MRFILTGGQCHDITQAEALLEGFTFEIAIGDKAYDAETFRQNIADKGAKAVIPARENRKETLEFDAHLYKERHLVECFIGKFKYYRRIFSRFDKLAKRFLSFVQFAGTLIWLK